MKKFAAFILIFLTLTGVSEAFIREGRVPGRNGLLFSGVHYNFDSLTLTITNKTKYNRTFGGSMLFYDRHYKLVARAELRPARVKRYASRKYKAFFTKGSGNEARSANFLEWEF
ncbi:MAG: hypothetical protein IJT21_02070 [Synergistaceae bacterium]|nr:hypothetical protein [Synergistaceae bacterium]